MNDETKWRETIPEGEADRFDALGKLLAGAGKLEGRPLHRHALGSFRGELTVRDVPAELRHGLFAKDATYEAYVRFSSGAGRKQSDRIPDVRAIAVKVVGVDGDKIIPGLEKARTQDFLTILSSTFGFKDPAAFVDIALAAPRGVPSVIRAAMKHFGFFGAFGKLKTLQSALDKSPASLATRTFFTALPIRLGPHAAKLRFRPIDAAVVETKPGPDVLGRELATRIAAGPIAYALEAQVFVDEASTPIEDPTVEWSSPWQTLARLTIPAQDAASAEGRALAEYVETLSFDPWHALPEHRPLGAIMRARGAAYKHAVIGRAATSELEVKPPSSFAR
jgi:hypothetical protein